MNTKRFKTTVGSMLTAMFALCIISCSEEDERMESVQPDATERKAYVAEMKFESGVPTFGEQTNETRAYTDAWENGARLYLQFYNGSARVDGLAVYSSATDSWTVNYYGTITKGQQATCEVYYFENPGTATYESVTLTPETAVFADKAGTYLYENGEVKVSAQLAAQTGRLRWKGTVSQEFTFTGLTCHTSYSILNNTLSTQETDITQTVSSNGYSPYVYGSFTSEAKLTVESDNDEDISSFSKIFDASVLTKGKSGFINIPTMESRNGWVLIRSVKKVVDLGLSVKWANYNIGAISPEEYGDYFAWGETEAKSAYTQNTYKWYNGSETSIKKYFYGDKTVLDLEDDVAHVKWGGKWRMPTRNEFQELIDKCTWVWTVQNGVNGYVVRATNGNSIFFPAAGCNNDEGYVWRPRNEYGYYWSSDLYESNNNIHACLLSFGDSGFYWTNSGRFVGFPVRPVRP